MSSHGYSRLVNDPTSSNTFVSDTLQQQDVLMREQDEDLDKVSGSLHTLKNISHQIGNELEEQSEYVSFGPILYVLIT